MIGHGKITTQKVYDVYRSRNEGVEILLKCRDLPVEMNDNMKSFMITANDDLILFTACLPDHRETTPALSAALSDVLRTPSRAISTQRQAEPVHSPLPASPLPTRVKKELRHGDDNASSFSQRARGDIFQETSVPATSVPEHQSTTPVSTHGRDVSIPLTSQTPAFNANVHPADAFGGNDGYLAMPSIAANHVLKSNVLHPDASQHRPEYNANTQPFDACAPQNGSATTVKHETTPDSDLPPHLDAEEQMPFDPDTFFHRGSSPPQADEEEMKPTDQAIRGVIEYQDPRVLEAGVAQVMSVLAELK